MALPSGAAIVAGATIASRTSVEMSALRRASSQGHATHPSYLRPYCKLTRACGGEPSRASARVTGSDAAATPPALPGSAAAPGRRRPVLLRAHQTRAVRTRPRPRPRIGAASSAAVAACSCGVSPAASLALSGARWSSRRSSARASISVPRRPSGCHRTGRARRRPQSQPPRRRSRPRPPPAPKCGRSRSRRSTVPRIVFRS